MICWDTSAFARIFLRDDPGFEQATNLIVSEPRNAASVLLWPESASALQRRASAMGKRRSFDVVRVRQLLETFEIVDVVPPLAQSAFELARKHSITGTDAVHLATAIELSRRVGRKQLRFAVSDRELASAARSAGLRLVTPGL